MSGFSVIDICMKSIIGNVQGVFFLCMDLLLIVCNCKNIHSGKILIKSEKYCRALLVKIILTLLQRFHLIVLEKNVY